MRIYLTPMFANKMSSFFTAIISFYFLLSFRLSSIEIMSIFPIMEAFFVVQNRSIHSHTVHLLSSVCHLFFVKLFIYDLYFIRFETFFRFSSILFQDFLKIFLNHSSETVSLSFNVLKISFKIFLVFVLLSLNRRIHKIWRLVS